MTEETEVEVPKSDTREIRAVIRIVSLKIFEKEIRFLNASINTCKILIENFCCVPLLLSTVQR